MCNIAIFRPGFTPPVHMIENVVWNNPHGFGLVLKDKEAKKLQVIKSTKKDLDEGVSPKKVYDLLKKHEDVERFLHVRNKTDGDIIPDNVQPFVAYHSQNRDVLFMHNGTLADYKPKYSSAPVYDKGVLMKPGVNETASDSRKFNDEFLAPLLLRFEGENGRGDYHDPVFKAILSKYWGSAQHNRGLIVSNDQDPLLVNNTAWETIRTPLGDFLSSNNQYFDKLIRGPEYDRREKERKEKEDAERKSKQSTFQFTNTEDSWPVTPLRQVSFLKKALTATDIKTLMEDPDIYSVEGLAALKNVGPVEFEQFVTKVPDDATSLLIHLTDEFAKLHEKYESAIQHLQTLNKKK